MRLAFLATNIRYARGSIWVLLLLPNPSSNPELELLLVPTGEEEGHVPLDYEPIVAISHLPVAIPDTSWGTFPNKFPAIPPNLEAVAVVSSIIFVAHEPQECHVHWGHAQLERLEMEAEVLTKRLEYS